MKNKDPAENLMQSFKNYLIPATILFVVILFSTLLIDSFMEAYWPYLLMAGLLVLIELLVKIGESKWTILLALTSMVVILFGAQFFFYFVIPDYYDYQPITNPRLLMIYQLQGKIQIFYSPDYPKQGETISGYISACSNDFSKCIDIEKYALTAFFVDEAGSTHNLIDNVEYRKKSNFELQYMGQPIYVKMEAYNSTYSFILPKQSFWQTFQTEFNRHPVYGFLSLLATILGIVTVIKLSKITNLFTRIKNAYTEDIKRIMKSFKKNKRRNERA